MRKRFEGKTYKLITNDSRTDKKIDKLIEPFAIKVNNKTQCYVNYANKVGLTNDDLGKVKEGEYLLFGTDEIFDIVSVSSTKEMSSIVRRNILRNKGDILQAIEEMAIMNDTLYDYSGANSYRGKVIELSGLEDDSTCKYRRTLKPRKTRKEYFDVDLEELEKGIYLSECDDFALFDDEVILKNNKNDRISFYLSY